MRIPLLESRTSPDANLYRSYDEYHNRETDEVIEILEPPEN